MKKLNMIYQNEVNLYWSIEEENNSYTTTYGKLNEEKRSTINNSTFEEEVERKLSKKYKILDLYKSLLLKESFNYNTVLFCDFTKEEYNNYITYLNDCNEYLSNLEIKSYYLNDKTNDYSLLLNKVDACVNTNELNKQKYNAIIVLNSIKCTLVNNNNYISVLTNEKKFDLIKEFNSLDFKKNMRVSSFFKKAISKNIDNNTLAELADQCYDKNVEGIYSIIAPYYKDTNLELCVEYYKKGVSVNDEYAILELAIYYCEGTVIDVNYEESYKLLSLLDKDDIEVLFYTSIIMKSGFDKIKNYEKAFENFNFIINNSKNYRFKIESMIEIANMYLNGLGVEQDIQQAFYYTRIAIYLCSDFVIDKDSRYNPYNELEKLKKSHKEITNLDIYYKFDEVDYKEIKDVVISEEWCNIFDTKDKEMKKQLVVEMYKSLGLNKIANNLNETLIDIKLTKTNDKYQIEYILDTYFGYIIFNSYLHSDYTYNFFKNNNLKHDQIENIYNTINDGFYHSESFIPDCFISSINGITSLDNEYFSIRLDELNKDYIIYNNKKITIDNEFFKNTYWIITDELNLEEDSICINKDYPNLYFRYNEMKRELNVKIDDISIIDIIDEKINIELNKFNK